MVTCANVLPLGECPLTLFSLFVPTLPSASFSHPLHCCVFVGASLTMTMDVTPLVLLGFRLENIAHRLVRTPSQSFSHALVLGLRHVSIAVVPSSRARVRGS